MKWVLACLLLPCVTVSFQTISLGTGKDIESFQLETYISFSSLYFWKCINGLLFNPTLLNSVIISSTEYHELSPLKKLACFLH